MSGELLHFSRASYCDVDTLHVCYTTNLFEVASQMRCFKKKLELNYFIIFQLHGD